MRLLTASILLLACTLSWGQSSKRSARTKIEGFFGGAWMCDELQASDLRLLDCRGTPNYGVTASALSSISQTFEELAFQELAKRSHDQSRCLNSFFNQYFPSIPMGPGQAPLKVQTPSGYLAQQSAQRAQAQARAATQKVYHDAAWERFQALKQDIKEMLAIRDRMSGQLNARTLSHDPMDRSATEGQRELERARLREDLAATDEAIKIKVAQIPMGHLFSVYAALTDMALAPTVTRAQFELKMKGALTKLIVPIRNSTNLYNGLKNEQSGLYALNRTQKITLAQMGGIEALMGVVTSDPSERQRLSCQLRAYYKNGPSTTRTLEMLALTAASMGVYSIASAPLRLMANLAINAGTAYQITYALRDKCFVTDMNAAWTESGQCDPTQPMQGSVQVANRAMCAAAVIFGAGSSSLEVARYFPKI